MAEPRAPSGGTALRGAVGGGEPAEVSGAAGHVLLDDQGPLGSRGAAFLRVRARSGREVAVYGTHLDHLWHESRLAEAGALLEHIDAHARGGAVVVAADWNQQRPGDYLAEEWTLIVANKAARHEPPVDGVDELLRRRGFRCCIDDTDGAVRQQNWPRGAPPPPTHWTSTVVDYAYCTGGGVRAAAVYVVPSTVSDHLPVVIDWAL